MTRGCRESFTFSLDFYSLNEVEPHPAASKTVVNAAMVMYSAIAPWQVDIKAMPINAGRAIEEGSSFFTRYAKKNWK